LKMTDVLTRKQRSYNMSMIKGRNTQPEIRLRKMLYANALRGYRLRYRLIGKPDIVFPKKKLAVFIDGCFWHKCPKCFIKPASNRKFWNRKIESNIKRDKVVNVELRKKGWKVLRIWEHELKNEKIIKRKIINRIKNDEKKD